MVLPPAIVQGPSAVAGQKKFFLGGGGATWPSERNLGGMENFGNFHS